MKKFIKRMMSVMLVSIFCLASLVGCTGDNNNNGFKYTGNETVLEIAVFNGGLGYSWLSEVARDFEIKYANVSFEEGKLGVRVKPNPDKTNLRDDLVKRAIDTGINMSDIYYLAVFTGTSYIYGNYSANITDAVTQKVYTDDGQLADMVWDTEQKKLVPAEGAVAPTKSIADKMVESNRDGYYYKANQLDFNKDGTADHPEGYYSLPFENSLSGFIYDYDLFKDMGWLDYDGVDGLPDNLDDFWDLLDRIVTADMIPFTFSDGVTNYWQGIYDSFVAQYEGYKAAELNYNYNGTYTFPLESSQEIKADYPMIESEDYVTVNADGTYTVEINRENAWILAYQPSKKALVEFMRKLFSPKYFDAEVYESSFNYTAAQDQFVLSKLGKKKQKRIAMLYEGEWWENEARTNFNYTGGYGKREFRFFPMPYIEGQKDESVRSVADYSRGVDLFVNKKTKKLELCKLWLQFAHTEKALETFTLHTGVTRFYDYDLSEEQLTKLTPFARNTYKIKLEDAEKTGVTMFASRAKFASDEFSQTQPMGGFGQEIISTKMTSSKHMAYFMVHSAGVEGHGDYVSAKDYLDGIREYYSKESWENAYSLWLNKQ